MTDRLTTTEGLPESVQRPGYVRDARGTGIVHIGLGAFHKAHQAVYTDDALAASGGYWRIIGVSLRSAEPAAELAPQNGLYTVIARDAAGSRARVIGAMPGAYCLKTQRQPVLDALCAPHTWIVSITVTEKGYGLDRATGGIDTNHPAITADLATPETPQGLAGLLVLALRQRRAAGVPPFTILSCDNLPENGPLTRDLIADLARHAAPDLVNHILTDVAFPSTMVDRITPTRRAQTGALARQMMGHVDAAAIETEAFSQWVIEDHFPTGRPEWEAGDAIFVDDVRPYETMKLRMLNGAHSMLAYAGFAAGHRYVRDVMADMALARLVRRHLGAAAATLPTLPGVDFRGYTAQLEDWFRNPHLAHGTCQIAMDGSENMPQRLFSAIPDARQKAVDIRAFAFATAAWLRHLSLSTHDCVPYDSRDPRKETLTAIGFNRTAAEIVQVMRTADFIDRAIADDTAFWTEVTPILDDMLSRPMTEVIAQEAS
ncbi:mannitol dehydrogenase family protein [Primorskyibacter aestuariivivens]|uniref:mannitol dehydrogenase family protein n=1 Tax=Primorskyibacter aestuariivivens TaxID=1888912 RepID=UPI0022FFEE23|nr:mannitol dehydrogenase family protein [Primorskyibacter aestuariivivens]MDA7430941.1 mannitol dehydrogenase family protein [Primorskyibacter aestuariivivens]